MKNFKKIMAVLIAAVLVLGLTIVASAETINIGHAVDGETYTAYKLMDAVYADDVTEITDETPISYFYTGTANDALYQILDDYFQFEAFKDGKAELKVVDANGAAIDYSKVDVAALAKAINDAMDAKTLSLTAAGNARAVTTGEGENAVTSATITVGDKGYYFVNTSLGAVCSIDTAGTVTINEKNTTTTVDKTVEEDSTDDFGDKDDAQIGDTINFKSVVTIGKGQKNVVFHDVMQIEKLAFNANSVAVTGADGHYTIKTGNDAAQGDTFTVVFDSAWTESLKENTEVTITYSATLTADAIVGNQSGLQMDSGNDNKTQVTYGNAQNTEWDWTRTYTWGFNIYKYTGSTGSETALAGAKFNLKLGNEVLHFIQVSAGDTTNPAVYKYDASADNTVLVTPASGLITLNGLDADTYTLTETDPPVGYNKLDADVTVVLDSNTDSAQGNDGTHQADATLTITQDDTEVNQVRIQNNTGSTLPSTGGIGTTIFYIIGGCVVVAAIIFLVVRSKKSSAK